jgi:hypothetical protein
MYTSVEPITHISLPENGTTHHHHHPLQPSGAATYVSSIGVRVSFGIGLPFFVHLQ